MKPFIRRSLRKLGVDVARVRDRPDLAAFLNDRSIDVVLDVGANVGQFGERLRAAGYRKKIVSFEPVSFVYETLARKAKADGNWEVHKFALGAVAEKATINVSDNTTYSSILAITDAATRHDTAAAATHQETIDVRRLDEVFPTLAGNVLLKIDTQGYEKQVLEGGRQALTMMKGVLMELPIIHLYEGTWQFHEALEFMTEIGFVPAQIHPVNYHVIDPLSVLEVDCLFRPRDRRLD
jgi:FkbM family methyltransferase